MTDIETYITQLFAQEDEALSWARSAPEREQMPRISVEPFEGKLLNLLAQLVGARKIVEIGTLAGYSGIWLARALPEDGQLYTLEISSKHVEVAQANFERAGVSDRVTIQHGNAIDHLNKLTDKGPFDMVFLDAKRDQYLDYLKWTAANLRIGGLLVSHNAHRGALAAQQPDNEDAAMMNQFLHAVAEHPQLTATIISMGDGMLAARKTS